MITLNESYISISDLDFNSIEKQYNIKIDSTTRTKVMRLFQSSKDNVITIDTIHNLIDKSDLDPITHKNFSIAYASAESFFNKMSLSTKSNNRLLVALFASVFIIKLKRLSDSSDVSRYNEIEIPEFFESIIDRAKKAFTTLWNFLFPQDEDADIYVYRRRQFTALILVILVIIISKYGL